MPQDVEQNFVDILQDCAQVQPASVAFLFQDGSFRTSSLTYSELDLRARIVGAALRARGIARGECALLLFDTSPEYVAALLGCFYAGVIAVPLYPPRLDRKLERLTAVIRDCPARIWLTSAAHVPGLSGLPRTVVDYMPEVMAIDNLDESLAADWRDGRITSNSLALLQYSSGSTGRPKGVMLTHGNLIANCKLIKRCFALEAEDSGVIWLPLYHDMGLIGGVLEPLFSRFACTLMRPNDFLKHPVSWLRSISERHGTCSGGPNFAYELCISRVTDEERRRLDLSSWKVAFVGAEMVRESTLEKFAAVFEPCGFRRHAFCSCYGLSEATLIVSGAVGPERPVVKSFSKKRLEQQEAVQDSLGGTQRIVSCGRKIDVQHEFRIVHPERGTELSQNMIGEIWVAGPSVAQGYFGRPAESQSTFAARLSETGTGPFLRTGDLGFVDNGELYLVGRLNDVIVIAGRNHFPHDIECTVQDCIEVAGGTTAAFALSSDGYEALALVQEIGGSQRHRVHELEGRIRKSVAHGHGVSIDQLVFVKPSSIPRTSSGKVRRSECRRLLLAGAFEDYANPV